MRESDLRPTQESTLLRSQGLIDSYATPPSLVLGSLMTRNCRWEDCAKCPPGWEFTIAEEDMFVLVRDRVKDYHVSVASLKEILPCLCDDVSTLPEWKSVDDVDSIVN